ncbi:hypothetical protein LTR08_003479 [Meristemomyces frigidus]|nr:hypothetical protein LTR08_003479 [Meristemomyces frigidus]
MTAAMGNGWAHAVPLDETTGFAQRQRTDTLKSQGSGHRDLRNSARRRPSDFDIVSDSEAMGTRKASIRVRNASTSRKRSRNTLRETRDEDAVDDSAWIHRDKLAQIEIQEMAQAGVHVRPPRRSSSTDKETIAQRASRSMSRSRAPQPASKERPTTSEQYGDEQHGPLYESFDDYKPRISTVPSAGEREEYEQTFDHTIDTEIRTPEEVAAEQLASKQHMIRPSTSRIPISKASPLPVPQTVVARDSPLPRSRAGSGAWSGVWDETHNTRRARSSSIGSQVLFDDVEGVKTPPRPGSSYIRTSTENSPPKARMPHKAAPTSGARQVSGMSGGPKARTPSTASRRPNSSSGHKSRPSTGHAAPEGEAPWIASMYKPDPRLPPDQQLLPTHAKRLMQEQWEKDGKTGTAYDRDFKPLNANGHDFEQQQQQKASARARAPPLLQPADPNTQWTIEPLPSSHASPVKASPNLAEEASPSGMSVNRPWPLSPTKSDTKSESGSLRPGTSGGYRVIPTIAPAVSIERSTAKLAPPIAPHNPTPRVPADYGEDDEKQLPEAKRKKGGCCVVM